MKFNDGARRSLVGLGFLGVPVLFLAIWAGVNVASCLALGIVGFYALFFLWWWYVAAYRQKEERATAERLQREVQQVALLREHEARQVAVRRQQEERQDAIYRVAGLVDVETMDDYQFVTWTASILRGRGFGIEFAYWNNDGVHLVATQMSCGWRCSASGSQSLLALG